MKPQTLKSLAIPFVTLLIVFATSLVSANAQTSSRVYAEIPFDFVVGDKVLNAGKYSVSSGLQDGSALIVRNVKAKGIAIRLTSQLQSRSSKTNARLVFHRYGQTYFLAEVWHGADNTGRALSPSKAERALQRERAFIGRNNFETVDLIASVR